MFTAAKSNVSLTLNPNRLRTMLASSGSSDKALDCAALIVLRELPNCLYAVVIHFEGHSFLIALRKRRAAQ